MRERHRLLTISILSEYQFTFIAGTCPLCHNCVYIGVMLTFYSVYCINGHVEHVDKKLNNQQIKTHNLLRIIPIGMCAPLHTTQCIGICGWSQLMTNGLQNMECIVCLPCINVPFYSSLLYLYWTLLNSHFP